MKLLIFLKRICDVSIYMALVSTLNWALFTGSFITTLPFLITSCVIMALLNKRNVLKFSALVPLGFTIYIIPFSWESFLFLAPIIIYLTKSVIDENWQLFDEEYIKKFKFFIATFFTIVFIFYLMILTDFYFKVSDFGIAISPPLDISAFSMIFLFCSVVYMNHVRSFGLDGGSFRKNWATIKPVSAVFILAIFMTVIFVIDVHAILIRTFWQNLIAPIIYGLAWIFMNVFRHIPVMEIEENEGYPVDSESFYGVEENYQQYQQSEIFAHFIYFMLFLLFVGLVNYLFKKLRHRLISSPVEVPGIRETFTRIEDKSSVKKRESQLFGVRKIYRKSITEIDKDLKILTGFETTKDIEENINRLQPRSGIKNLRHLYLKVRYGLYQPSDTEVSEYKKSAQKIEGDLKRTKIEK